MFLTWLSVISGLVGISNAVLEIRRFNCENKVTPTNNSASLESLCGAPSLILIQNAQFAGELPEQKVILLLSSLGPLLGVGQTKGKNPFIILISAEAVPTDFDIKTSTTLKLKGSTLVTFPSLCGNFFLIAVLKVRGITGNFSSSDFVKVKRGCQDETANDGIDLQLKVTETTGSSLIMSDDNNIKSTGVTVSVKNAGNVVVSMRTLMDAPDIYTCVLQDTFGLYERYMENNLTLQEASDLFHTTWRYGYGFNPWWCNRLIGLEETLLAENRESGAAIEGEEEVAMDLHLLKYPKRIVDQSCFGVEAPFILYLKVNMNSKIPDMNRTNNELFLPIIKKCGMQDHEDYDKAEETREECEIIPDFDSDGNDAVIFRRNEYTSYEFEGKSKKFKSVETSSVWKKYKMHLNILDKSARLYNQDLCPDPPLDDDLFQYLDFSLVKSAMLMLEDIEASVEEIEAMGEAATDDKTRILKFLALLHDLMNEYLHGNDEFRQFILQIVKMVIRKAMRLEMPGEWYGGRGTGWEGNWDDSRPMPVEAGWETFYHPDNNYVANYLSRMDGNVNLTMYSSSLLSVNASNFWDDFFINVQGGLGGQIPYGPLPNSTPGNESFRNEDNEPDRPDILYEGHHGYFGNDSGFDGGFGSGSDDFGGSGGSGGFGDTGGFGYSGGFGGGSGGFGDGFGGGSGGFGDGFDRRKYFGYHGHNHCCQDKNEDMKLISILKKLYFRLSNVQTAEEIVEFSSFIPANVLDSMMDFVKDLEEEDGEYLSFVKPWRMFAMHMPVSAEVLQTFLKMIMIKVKKQDFPFSGVVADIRGLISYLDGTVKEEVRSYFQGDSEMTKILDFSSELLKIINNTLEDITDIIKKAAEVKSFNQDQYVLLGAQPGKEPSLMMNCYRAAAQFVAATKEREISETSEESPFFDTLSNFEDKVAQTPTKWMQFKSGIYRGQRSMIYGTMFWDKIAQCSCPDTYQYPFWMYGAQQRRKDENRPLPPSAPLTRKNVEGFGLPTVNENSLYNENRPTSNIGVNKTIKNGLRAIYFPSEPTSRFAAFKRKNDFTDMSSDIKARIGLIGPSKVITDDSMYIGGMVIVSRERRGWDRRVMDLGTICDENWNLNEAKVVCRNLVDRYVESQQYSLDESFGVKGDPSLKDKMQAINYLLAPIMMSNVTCPEDAQNILTDCSYDGWEKQDCLSYKRAGVLCILKKVRK